MTNKKIIFLVISIVVIVLLTFVIMNLNNSQVDDWWDKNTTSWLKIWTVWDDKSKFESFLSEFKALNKSYEKVAFTVESFSDYNEYELAMASALARWEAPDIFVLNNNTSSYLDSYIEWIDPSRINPNDFRKKYKWIFSDELITSYKDEQLWRDVEYLLWIPVWYESLWIYYNRRDTKSSDLSTLAWLSNVVSNMRQKDSRIIPLWIWNWSTVVWAEDIITQLLILEWIMWINSSEINKIKEAFSTYFMYWNKTWRNRYNSKFTAMKQDLKDNLDLFADWDIAMVVWYPRLLEEIIKNWYWSNLLLARPFPHYSETAGKTLINYNYFVISKDTQNYNLAMDLLEYMQTDNWAEKFLSNFTYYLPALLNLEDRKLSEKIDPKFNVILWDFVNTSTELTSFDKWLKNIYDEGMLDILDDENNYDILFKQLRNYTSCMKKKIVDLQGLSASCQ